MRVLLVKPCWPFPYGKGENTYNRIWPPLSLANCAAILEQDGHVVDILDAHALRIRPEKAAKFVHGYDKVFITSSTLDRWLCPNINIGPFLEVAKEIRKVTEDFYVMGYHGTVTPEKVLDQTQARAVIRGEPEFVVKDVCQGKELPHIEGVSYKMGGRIVHNAQRPAVDLKALPLPAFYLLDFTKYRYELLGKNFGLFEMSRGCRHSCEFCNKVMYGEKIRVKTAGQVTREIQVAVEEHGVKTGYFIDLEFLADKRLVNDVCDFLIGKKYDFRWCCQTRPDSLNEDILDKMKNAGCALIHFGIESGVQKFLDLTKKNMSLETGLAAVRLCQAKGVQTLAFFLFGFADETESDREQIFDYAMTLNADYISLHRVYPYKAGQVCTSGPAADKDIDKFIRQKLWRYYFRLSKLKRLNFKVLMRTLEIFIGRLATLS